MNKTVLINTILNDISETIETDKYIDKLEKEIKLTRNVEAKVHIVRKICSAATENSARRVKLLPHTLYEILIDSPPYGTKILAYAAKHQPDALVKALQKYYAEKVIRS